jgi:hypothetical protein
MCALRDNFDVFGHCELPWKLEDLREKNSVTDLKYVSFLFAAVVRDMPRHDKYLASSARFNLETHREKRETYFYCVL